MDGWMGRWNDGWMDSWMISGQCENLMIFKLFDGFS
jgi:hypothetical protein